MHISYYTISAGLNPAVGYGYAGQNIIESLQKLGHRVTHNDQFADVQLNFSQPNDYLFNKNQYQIGYTPWESTLVDKPWVDRMNMCDEVWATSKWVKDVYLANGVTKDIKVFPHGVDKVWKAKKRVLKEGEPLRFLHIGEPAPRKAGQLVVDTFIKLFGNNPDYLLTIKAHHSNTTRVYLGENKIATPNAYKNIRVITDEYSVDQMVNLYQSHHVLVYPSWGEGFGFIPLQALATGMPTICTYDWADYERFLGPLKLKSRLTNEHIPKSIGHPYNGMMYKPDAKHLEDLMVEAVINYKAYAGYYFAQSEKVHKEYDWNQLTKNAFDDLAKKFP
jgi:glycosyltransferase involved in cell wall biosynthesis